MAKTELARWVDRAACRDADPAIFYPKRGKRANVAREYCSRCPVASECFEAGRTYDYGIWGGLNRLERRAS